MRYRDAIEYIIDRDGYERGFVANPFSGDAEAALGLQRTAGLLDLLGNPERQYRIAHVAGTKGKGSTCAMLDSMARAAGFTTGMYVTPHLHSFRERIMLNGAAVSEGEFAGLTVRVAEAVEQFTAAIPQPGSPTAFEIVTVMALLAFADAQVDLAVVEVGLGGRLDATNVVTPDVAAISTVSIDHAAILGNSLEQIASEKGGIIKAGKPVVIGPQHPDALATLLDIAAQRAAPAAVAGHDWTTERTRLHGPWGDWHNVELGLAGGHQMENAGLALMAFWDLYGGKATAESVLRDGLRSVSWPGRFELISSNPDVIVDGAHNVDSMRRLVETLHERTSGSSLTIVLGLARDKDLHGILAELAALDADLVATASHNPRAVEPHVIANAASALGIQVRTAESTLQALDMARVPAREDGTVCVTGSLYVVAEAREALGLAETPEFERSLLYR